MGHLVGTARLKVAGSNPATPTYHGVKSSGSHFEEFLHRVAKD